MEKVAGSSEILEILTAFMRGKIEGATPRERLRAAELLGKRQGLFDSGGDPGGGPVVIMGCGELEA
jgi:hypothetical protein